QHARQGNFVTKIVAPSTAMPIRAAFRIAFCSAWQITFSFSSGSPRNSLSSCIPRANPLKPVDKTTLVGDAITAPTRHRSSFDLIDAAIAIQRKYSSQLSTHSGIHISARCASSLGVAEVIVGVSALGMGISLSPLTLTDRSFPSKVPLVPVQAPATRLFQEQESARGKAGLFAIATTSFHFLLFGYRENEGARETSSRIIHCSKVMIREASSPIQSKNMVLGQPTVSTSERTLRGSNMRTHLAPQYSTILL